MYTWLQAAVYCEETFGIHVNMKEGFFICPECGEYACDTYQRVVGFLTPSKSYSKERFKEFSARQWYDTAVMYGETSVIGD
jgi:anaerobic ribonucleoside-triphosphate reductase